MKTAMMKTMLLLAMLGLMLAATGDAGAPVAGVVTLGTTVEITQAIAVGNRASKLIGAAVYNEQGEKIGSVDDLIISPDRSVSFAIVSVGGFLGLGSRLVAIPEDLGRIRQLTEALQQMVSALAQQAYAGQGAGQTQSGGTASGGNTVEGEFREV